MLTAGREVLQGLQAMLCARASRRSLLTVSDCLSPPSLGKKKWFWLMQMWFGASVRSLLLPIGICQVLQHRCAAGLPAGRPSTAPRSCPVPGPSGGARIPLRHSPGSSCPASVLQAARGCTRGSRCPEVLLEQQWFERRPLSWVLGTSQVCAS